MIRALKWAYAQPWLLAFRIGERVYGPQWWCKVARFYDVPHEGCSCSHR